MTHAARLLILAFMLGTLHPLSTPTFAQSTGSPLDVQREQAAALFGPRLAALSAIQLQAAADRRRYEVGCKGKTTTITPKAMTGVPLNGPVIGQGGIVSLGTLPVHPAFPANLEARNETSPTCRILGDQLKTSEAAMAAGLFTIDEAARRRGVLPGIMRDLKVAYGFQP